MAKEKKQSQYKRPSWDEYFMELVEVVGKRATCDRGRSGCLVTRDNYILMSGYVGSPRGLPHCDEVGHELHTVIHDNKEETQHCIRTAHAEQNAIASAARFGISLDGGTLYCKMTPCYVCAKMIVNCGIKRVVCQKDYHAGEKSKNVFKKAGVKYDLLGGEMQTYENM